MNEIRTINELVKAFELEGMNDGNSIEAQFPSWAASLMNNFAIRKGDQLFRFVEIEFYHNLTDDEIIDGKLKKITYKRESESCDFFFHNYGFDICFKSDSIRYGGVLIRSVKSKNGFINGPGRVADRLFDRFSAVRPPKDFPQLVALKEYDSIVPVVHKRWHIAGEKLYRFTWPWEDWKPDKKYDARPWDDEGNLLQASQKRMD